MELQKEQYVSFCVCCCENEKEMSVTFVTHTIICHVIYKKDCTLIKGYQVEIFNFNFYTIQ